MSTLTLKKSKASTPILDKPTLNLINKFVVMRQARGTKSFRFTSYHDSLDTSVVEAKRLVNMYPTERFLVLQVVEGVES
jgi:hypothetical protein